MTTVNLKGDNASRIVAKMKSDTIVLAMMNKSPEEIITWWNSATNSQKDDVMLRMLLMVSGLIRGIDFTKV